MKETLDKYVIPENFDLSYYLISQKLFSDKNLIGYDFID
jgi:hypothetical protein